MMLYETLRSEQLPAVLAAGKNIFYRQAYCRGRKLLLLAFLVCLSLSLIHFLYFLLRVILFSFYLSFLHYTCKSAIGHGL
jgi:hypothetical protein